MEEESSIHGKFWEFYKKLFTSEKDGRKEEVLEIVPSIVTREMNEGLIKEVIDEEIMKVVFELRALKALGLDGFNGMFYQKYWEIVKEGW